MRLSRLGTALNWKLAVGELLLIVGGVLIALGVDSWREARQERVREQAYVRQLLADMRDVHAEIEETIASDSTLADRLARMLDRTFQGPLPPADTFGITYTGYDRFQPPTGTYTALIQSGDIQLLRNDSLRFKVISYAAQVTSVEQLLQQTEAIIWNVTERLIRSDRIHSQTSGQPGLPHRRWQGIDQAAALSDPEVVSALMVHRQASGNRVRPLQRLRAPTRELIELLEAELQPH